jgi:uncharacterized low-complexity protein
MKSLRPLLLCVSAFALLLAVGACGSTSANTAVTASNPCGENPCRENPCGENPCGENPCGNPCGGIKIDATKVTEPDGWKANTATLDDAALLAKGDELWNNTALSQSGAMACITCHQTSELYKATFTQPYPHKVEMPHQMSGMSTVSEVEMVQFCMMAPMKTEPLAWDSLELAALVRKVKEEQKTFEPATK